MLQLGPAHNVAQRSKAESQPSTDRHLPIEPILRSNDVVECAKRDASPGCQMEDGQGIIGPEEQAFMNFWIATEVEQHLDPIGQREGGDVRIKIRVSLYEIAQSRQKLFIEDQSITAGMRGNHGSAFFQRRPEAIRVSDGLIFSDEAEFIADVTQERELPLGEGSVKRFVVQISWIELLRVWEDLHQCGAGIGATMDFFDGVPSLRIDRDAGEELIRVGPCNVEYIVVADEKVCVRLVEAAVLVVHAVHTKEYGSLNMVGGAQFGEQIVEIFPVRFPRVCRGQLVFP